MLTPDYANHFCYTPPPLLFKAHYRCQLQSDLTSSAPEMEDCAERTDISIQRGVQHAGASSLQFYVP